MDIEDLIVTCTLGVKRIVLNLESWTRTISGMVRWKLHITISITIDGQESQDKPIGIECTYVSLCYEIKLEPSCTY